MPIIPIIILLGLFLGLSGYTLATLPLGLDEAYYAYWAQHPALSYLDHPPLIAWLITVSTALFGNSEFGVRLGGCLLSWVGFGAAFATARRLFPAAPPSFAWEYLLLLNLTFIFPGASLIQTPDTPLFACWMLALYFGARILINQKASAWYGLGAAFGLGLLAKYTMVLLAPAIFLWLLITPQHRYWLRRREPWLAAGLALLIFAPVLIWNVQHDWISFRFQLHHGFETNTAPGIEKLLGYWAGQAAIVSPLLWLGLVYYNLRGIGYDLQYGQPIYRYLALLTWIPFLFFAWTTIQGAPAEANWPASAYTAGLLLAWAVLRLNTVPTPKRLLQVIFVSSLMLNIAVRIHFAQPWLPLPPAQDRLHEFASWPNLGRQVQQFIDAQPAGTTWFLIGDVGTRLAAALFYTKYRYLGVDLARPERYLFLPPFNSSFQGYNAVILVRAGRTLSEIQTLFGGYFRRITPAGVYHHQYRDTPVPRYDLDLYLGENFLGH